MTTVGVNLIRDTHKHGNKLERDTVISYEQRAR